MRGMKRSLSLLLCLLLSLSLFPAAALAEAPVLAVPAEGEEDFEIVVEQEPICYAPGGPADNEAMLSAFAQKRLDSLRPQGMSIQAVHDSGLALSGLNRTEFYNLKSRIASVANGTITSTVLTIPVSELGLSKTSWTSEELGVEKVFDNGMVPSETVEAINTLLGFSLREIVTALLSDCPYELYWYDKTVGTSHAYSYTYNKARDELSIVNSVFTFAVAGAYSDGTYKIINNVRYYCGVNTSFAESIASAVANAAAIAAEYEGADDYDKLRGFMDEICERVDYNSAAAGGGADYGDPWQLIWVFDGDETTNVVCEGYAKAFQYLCDISDLSASVMAYSVSGTMNVGIGAGTHMWNIVHMENGRNYLVDVTNCDKSSTGSSIGIGYPYALFMVGYTSGSVDEGYTVTANNHAITYTYEDKLRPVFSDKELKISAKSYLDDLNSPGVVQNLEQLKAEIDYYLESGEESCTIRFPESDIFEVYENVTIPMGMNFVVSKGRLQVNEGVVMTIARGGTVTAKNAQIDGTLSVSGTFSMNSSSSVLEVGGTLENKGSVVVLDTGFVRAENMTASGGRYYVEHFASTEAALRGACGIAEADSDSAVTHEIYPKAMIALSGDLTVPANSRMIINIKQYSDADFSTAEGVTLVNLGEIISTKSLQLLGTLLNNGTLRLMSGVDAEFGSYDGTGVLKVRKDSSDPFTHLIGLNSEDFIAELGQDNYWALRIKYTVTWLDEDGSILSQTFAPYGTVPEYGGETPTKAADAEYVYIFAGWTPEIEAVTEDTAYTAVYTAVPVFGTPDFTLPAGVERIEEEAFEGLAMQVVYVPDGCGFIGENAFKDCASLRQIRLPMDCEIDAAAFTGCTALIAVYAPAGGTVQSWCEQADILFIAE